MTLRNYLGDKKPNQMIFGEAGKGKIYRRSFMLFWHVLRHPFITLVSSRYIKK